MDEFPKGRIHRVIHADVVDPDQEFRWFRGMHMTGKDAEGEYQPGAAANRHDGFHARTLPCMPR